MRTDRYFVCSLDRGLRILACFRDGAENIGNLEFSKTCELPKSTVSRLTRTLTKLGYLSRAATGRYVLGPTALAMGVLYLHHAREASAPAE